jgi:hypothetical protein
MLVKTLVYCRSDGVCEYAVVDAWWKQRALDIWWIVSRVVVVI